MKWLLKSEEPDGLKQYREKNPEASWDNFKDEAQSAYKEVKALLITDQRNLCAYCEKELLSNYDQQVEHFHPKSDESFNWGLHWDNLLMCCLGGRSVNSDRLQKQGRVALEPLSENLHCDIKGDDIVDDQVLKPLDIPAEPCIWSYQSIDGSITVNGNACEKSGISISKAEKTIAVFNLNSPTLKSNRYVLYSQIRKRLTEHRERTQTIEYLISRYIKTSAAGTKHGYFSVARLALGLKAEAYLKKTGDF